MESYHRFIRPQRGWIIIDAGADYVCEKLALKDIDLMKVDVETSELEVVQGMQRVIPQHIVRGWHGMARLHKLRILLQEKSYQVVHRFLYPKPRHILCPIYKVSH